MPNTREFSVHKWWKLFKDNTLVMKYFKDNVYNYYPKMKYFFDGKKNLF